MYMGYMSYRLKKINYPINGFSPPNYSDKCSTCGTYTRQCEMCEFNYKININDLEIYK
jgi:hypothetical protein